jgi:ATP adenylyltransferase
LGHPDNEIKPKFKFSSRIKEYSSVGEHEQIWAPWRLSYVQATDQKSPNAAPKLDFLPGADPDCFICQAVVDSDSRGRLVVARGETSLTILNRYPYNNGHLLVAPRRHVGDLEDLTPGEHLEMAQTITRLVGLLREELRAEGFNVGLNLGRVGGAGLPGHLHWHIVPRWNGDTNFMPALAGVRVIPQSLEALWELLSKRLS